MSKVFLYKNKYYVIISITLTAFLFVLLCTFIISKISKKETQEGVAIVLNEGNLVINYVDGQEIETSEIYSDYSLSITNTESNRSYYTVQINNVKTEKEISISIQDEEGNIVNTINKFKETNNIVSLDTIDGMTTKRYKIIINNIINNKVSLELKVINESNTTRTFGDLILINNSIQEPISDVGTESAIQNEGLISTEDNDGISYYFRGNVNNNYIKIKDNYYRIIRINGNGTVRVILDYSISSKGAYNTNPIAAGADNLSLLDLNQASIKSILQEWYNANIYEYDTYIDEGNYCIEKQFDNIINNFSYSSVYDRIMVSHKPSLVCSNELTKSKVGLISIDEAIFAGASKKENKKYYLYNKEDGNDYLTNSIYSINIDGTITLMNIKSDGSIGEGITITKETSIRPVLNISVSAKVKGNGTIEDPYIIVA